MEILRRGGKKGNVANRSKLSGSNFRAFLTFSKRKVGVIYFSLVPS
jgi:hypothetical protein